MFDYAIDAMQHITSLPLEELNDVLTITEKDMLKRKRDNQQKYMKVSPNAPLAKQLVEDKVVDMLIFLTLRHYKAATKQILEMDAEDLLEEESEK